MGLLRAVQRGRSLVSVPACAPVMGCRCLYGRRTTARPDVVLVPALGAHMLKPCELRLNGEPSRKHRRSCVSGLAAHAGGHGSTGSLFLLARHYLTAIVRRHLVARPVLSGTVPACRTRRLAYARKFFTLRHRRCLAGALDLALWLVRRRSPALAALTARTWWVEPRHRRRLHDS